MDRRHHVDRKPAERHSRKRHDERKQVGFGLLVYQDEQRHHSHNNGGKCHQKDDPDRLIRRCRMFSEIGRGELG
ncbi:hypothetical protein D3C81_2058320 [compost metagenome]